MMDNLDFTTATEIQILTRSSIFKSKMMIN